MIKKTSEQISYNMRRVKSKDSVIEIMLRRELWARGLRYRKNVRSVFGTPDIVFIGLKIAVFVDSEFWHGYAWENKKFEIKSNRDFWFQKIERNIERDKEVNEYLISNGWFVLRFWGNAIRKDVISCADTIEVAYRNRKYGNV